ncbi:hypothetical protein BS78_08G031700 [Paspalum vaginatum]|nr:hypothetical protein BS78_08G031700 [Paspalum vaginatum]
MKATKILLVLAFVVLLSKCSPKAIMIGDKCIPKNCNNKCIALGGTRGNCISGPACNCVMCGPPSRSLLPKH